MPHQRQDHIVAITRNFPPLVGGMENLMRECIRALATHNQVHLVGPEGCEAHLPEGAQRAGTSRLKPLPRFLVATACQGVVTAWRVRPRWVLGGSGLMAPAVVAAARASGARSAVLVHGLDLVVPHRAYRMVFLPALRACDRVIANSRHTAGLALKAGIREQQLRIVNPGVAMPDPDRPQADARAALGLASGPVLLSVGRLSPRKGIAEFIERCLPALVAAHPGLVFLVAGGAATQALIGGDASAAISLAIGRTGLSGAVRVLGAVDDATLGTLYAAADAFVFPVKDQPGDVEGFGMSALEAAAHGVPTVGFSVGGVPDAVVAGRSGTLVVPGDYAALTGATLAVLAADPESTRMAARAYARTLTWARHAENLRQALDL